MTSEANNLVTGDEWMASHTVEIIGASNPLYMAVVGRDTEDGRKYTLRILDNGRRRDALGIETDSNSCFAAMDAACKHAESQGYKVVTQI